MAGIKSLQSLKQKACLTTVNSSQGAYGLEATMSYQDVKLANEVTDTNHIFTIELGARNICLF